MMVTPKNWLKENSRQGQLTSKGESGKEQADTLWEILPVPAGCNSLCLMYTGGRFISRKLLLLLLLLIINSSNIKIKK